MILKLDGAGQNGLEEDKIAGFSNRNGSPVLRYKYKEIAGYSNQHCLQLVNRVGLAEDKIAWYSNDSYITYPIDTGLEENKIARDSNIKSINQEKSVWKGVKLHGFQTHATLSSQNTLRSGRNCRILKQGCRRFCFVIIIPYPDRKANICSIRLRAEKGEV